jgi:hypothetical protein
VTTLNGAAPQIHQILTSDLHEALKGAHKLLWMTMIRISGKLAGCIPTWIWRTQAEVASAEDEDFGTHHLDCNVGFGALERGCPAEAVATAQRNIAIKSLDFLERLYSESLRKT